MKKSLSLTLLIFVTTILSAQYHISTDFAAAYKWNTTKNQWDLSGSDETTTFFEFNEEGTIVKHTSSAGTTTYMIKSSKTEGSEGSIKIKYDIVSDVGESYLLVIDEKDREVSMLPIPAETMIVFRIKAAWKDN